MNDMSQATDDLTLPDPVLRQIYAQARAEFPSECCGYFKGRGADTRVFPCVNAMDKLHAVDPETYPRTSANGYNFGGRELLAFTRGMSDADPPTVIYHSHPRVGAYFSREDQDAALSAGYPVDYLVIDVQDHAIGGAVLFRRVPSAPGDTYVAVATYPGLAL